MKILQNNRGSSLIGTLFLVLIMGMAGGAAVNMSTGERSNSLNEVQATQAFYVSQAGLEIAKKMAYEGTDPNGLSMNFGMGSFAVAYDGTTALSEAHVGNAVKSQSVEATLTTPMASVCGVNVDVANGRLYAAADGPLSIQVMLTTAGYTSRLNLSSPGPTRYLASSNDVGSIIPLGTFTEGTEVTFNIFVNNTGNTYYMGAASNNLDNVVHAAVTVDEDVTVGFEDLFGGGDQDFDDVKFRFVCEGQTSNDAYIVNGSAGAGVMYDHQMNVVAGQSYIVATTSGINVDLYARINAAPTTGSYTVRSATPSGNESFVYNAGSTGTLHIGVYGAQAGNYTLTVTPTGAVPNTVYLNQSGSVFAAQMDTYALNVAAGQSVFVRTAAPNDVDLYLRLGPPPTTSIYTMRAYTASGNETLVYTAPTAGTLFIGVYGYQSSSYTVTASSL